MPSQVLTNVENNFTKGLITEFTGLNFPENAATDCDNCEFTLIGDVNRRLGIDYESHDSSPMDRTGTGVSTYKWNNAGGDGVTEIVIAQVGSTLQFYRASSATAISQLSAQVLPFVTNIDLSLYTAFEGTFDITAECDYANGNGYCFVFHPSCDPIYLSYSLGTVTANAIGLFIRDFSGIPEAIGINVRPSSLIPEHSYNLGNQGWTAGGAWIADSVSLVQANFPTSHTFTVGAGIVGITGGDTVAIYMTDPSAFKRIPAGTIAMSGYVSSYVGTQLTIVCNSGYGGSFALGSYSHWTIVQTNLGHVTTWAGALGNYPSNGDVWWYFKNASGVFDPASRVANTTISNTNAPRGHYLLAAFREDRSTAANTLGINEIKTLRRPRTGAWFSGRVWYTGVDDQQIPQGDAPYHSWTNNIYFSQVITDSSQFGKCYQVNDPTSEELFDLLPTDGGVISIPEAGSIYKLVPLLNNLLVFAANGIWYITGSQGIGFAANDYTIYKLSAVRSISTTSFITVNGYPYFWNEEGIYSVEPTKQDSAPDARRNSLEVTPITVGTILDFYNQIPMSSKKFVRGAYNPIDYVIQWIYRDTEASTVTERYQFNRILNFNTYNKAFYPYSILPGGGNTTINSIVYVSYPGGLANPPTPNIKYLVSTVNVSSYLIGFADEHDTSYTDWTIAGVPTNYDSYFVTGYKLHGQGQRRFQIPYIYIFSRGDEPTSYKIQGLWDYAKSGDSGRWSTIQQINNWSPNFGMIFRRHRIRGQGVVLQIKVTSTDGQPFDIMGWSAFETQNTGV